MRNAVLAILALGCEPPAPPPPELRIGLVAPLSWEGGLRSEAILNTAELAVSGAAVDEDRGTVGFDFTVRLLTADSRAALAALSGLPGVTGRLGFADADRDPNLFFIRIADRRTELVGAVDRRRP